MTDDAASSDAYADSVTLTSPMLKAMAHPVRRRILGVMEHSSPARATDLAKALGLPANQVSFHLRSLAKAGLVAEAPEHARDRRDRVWVPTGRSYRISGPAEPLSAQDEQVVAAFFDQTALELQETVRRVLAWAADYAAGRDHEPRGAATQESVRLSAEQMRSLVGEIGTVIAAAQARARDTPDAEPRTWEIALFVARDDLAP